MFKLNGSNTRKSHFYCTLRYHCSTHPLWKWSNLMFFWIVFDFFSNVNSCVYLDLFTLQIQLEKVGLVKHPKKNDFHCTLRDHCRAIIEEKWTKFVSFWKIFLCSFKWDWPKIVSPDGVKDISLWSWMVKTPKSSTTTTAVIWHFSTKIPIYFWFFG